ncbi:MAG: CPBP family intramembrane glutamic endopeptidase, partial [bacterium]|nr:CPBP family intramembrane glutamic endopeptidase [bacterium]
NRQQLKRILGGETSRYNPESPVHTTALIFTILLIVISTVLLLLLGGTSGVAESIETEGISATEPLFYATLEVVFALLGVGFAIRRGTADTLERLGLRWPTRDDVRWGLGVLLVIFILLILYGQVISWFIPEDQLQEQNRAAQSQIDAFSTLPLALLLATSAAIGEEVFFRGAIQPIFGLIPTTIFFTVLHTQVLLTPGIVVIFFIGLLFGLLRQRHSTTAAIIAHFAYNFLLIIFSIITTSGGTV